MQAQNQVLDKVIDLSDDRLLIDIKQTARLLGISRGTALNWRWRGIFPLATVKMGKKVFVRATDIADFLSQKGEFSVHKKEAKKAGRGRSGIGGAK